ncbi:MAG TPA: hypothetical protein VLL52_13985 [Anaerolineae bacterium]|nr:hypothetical protein [Anaerolineae bacterium]
MTTHHAYYYQIELDGHLPPQWTDWFNQLTITHPTPNRTQLTGPLDQPALHGLLRQIRDLGLPLLAVNITPSPTTHHPLIDT